jgi:hypothetical protein
MSDESEISGPYRKVLDFIEGRNFIHTPHHVEQHVSLRLTGHHAEYRFEIRVSHGGDFLQITTYYPFLIRSEKVRPSVAELLARANYSMLIGKFEIDLADGEIRYHVSHLIEENLAAETVERLFSMSFLTVERYFPAIMQHLHAGYTPEDAVYIAELDYHSEKIADDAKAASRVKSTVMVPRKSREPNPGESEPAAPESKKSDPALPDAKKEGSFIPEETPAPVSRRGKVSRKKRGVDPLQQEFPFSSE